MKDLDGKPLKLKADLGAFKMIQKTTGKNPFQQDTKGSDVDPVFMSAMLYAFAKRGGSNVTVDFIDQLDFKDIMKMQSEMNTLMSETVPEEKEGNAKGQR